MRLFKCQHCGQLLYFENSSCENCGHRLGYIPARTTLATLDSDGSTWRPLDAPEEVYRFCINADYAACNWLIAAESPDLFCACCRHNRTVPNLGIPENLTLWQDIESAKHRLFYSLFRLNLPLANRVDDPRHGLAFDFLDDPLHGGRVMTGHDEGVITLAVREAVDAERERLRRQMGESYRTLLGHFRHEIGHYFWDRLVRDRHEFESFRALFGDERKDYGQSLRDHYRAGPPPHWQESHISGYATTHPWEDFAETWAHYLHIIDTLETAGVYGLSIHPALQTNTTLDAAIDFDPYQVADLQRILNTWFPLTIAVNSLNRSMGQPDLYPFVLTPAIIAKLGYIHTLVQAVKSQDRGRLAA